MDMSMYITYIEPSYIYIYNYIYMYILYVCITITTKLSQHVQNLSFDPSFLGNGMFFEPSHWV